MLVVTALAVVVGGVVLRDGDVETADLSASGVPVFAVERGTLVRSVVAEGYLVAVQATAVNVPVDVPGMQRISWIAADGAVVAADEVVVRLDPADLERDLADGQADMEIVGWKIEKASGESQALEQNLGVDAALAERQLEQAEQFASRDERIYSRQEILDSEIDRDLARATAENARDRGVTVADQGRAQLELLEIERTKAQLKIDRAQKGLASLEVRAPHDGMLVLERNWSGERPSVGDQVWPGQQLAEIPDPSQMQARSFVLEADAAGLKAGSRATLWVEAHPDRSHAARVDRVDALAKKLHHNVPVQYFEVVLIPEETDVGTMKPGQRIRAEVLLEEIEDAVHVPPQALFHEDDADWVFRREGGRMVRTAVTLGARSLSRVQVIEGLEPGDLVALRDPRRSAQDAAGGGPSKASGPPSMGGGG